MAKRMKSANSQRTNSRRERNVSREHHGSHSGNVIELPSANTRQRNKKIDIVPRSVHQEDYLIALNDPKKAIVFATGPAGCGKTMIAAHWAVKALWEGKFEKIVITRPNVAVDDRDIGFLPGDIFKKMQPWMMPILDEFKQFYAPKELERLMEEEIIEICPIAFIRGRTFKNAVVLVDEAQGTTPNSMLSILTRIGENSKMVITGDVKQSDRGFHNGLQDFMDKVSKLEQLEHVKVCRFSNKDIERHDAVKEVLRIYGQED